MATTPPMRGGYAVRIFITDREQTRLKELSAKTGVPVSRIVGQLVKEYLKGKR